jgi:hypothetical protein
MKVHTTRLSVVLALFCLVGVSILSSVASAQEPDDMNFEFPDAKEFVDFDPAAANEAAEEAAKAAAPIVVVCIIVGVAFWLLVLIGAWKVFTKAGKPGWAVIIPIYNAIVLLEICGRPIWWILLMLIPCVNVVIQLIVSFDLAKSFGKGPVFGIGLWLFGCIFVPVLGFGSAQYQGPAAAP